MLYVLLQVVSVRLARHVVKNQEKLIEGINNVTLVEDDLKVTYLRWPHAFVGSSVADNQLQATQYVPAMLCNTHATDDAQCLDVCRLHMSSSKAVAPSSTWLEMRFSDRSKWLRLPGKSSHTWRCWNSAARCKKRRTYIAA